MLVGVPLAWGIMFLYELAVMILLSLVNPLFARSDSPVIETFGLITIMACVPPVGQHDLSLIIPIATAMLLVPCFSMSMHLEQRSCLRSWPQTEPVALKCGVYFANLGSYALLFLLANTWLGYRIYFSKPRWMYSANHFGLGGPTGA